MKAYDLAVLSQLIYLDEYCTFSKYNTEGAVIERDDCNIIVFRGTTSISLKDWLSNMRMYPISYPYDVGRVHKGLFIDVRSVIDYINDIDDKPLYITGHSRGGGLAVVAAKMLLDLYNIPSTVYTFGSMNVGDYTFAKSIEDKIQVFRFTNNRDIVTRLPFLFGIYRGCGKRIHQFYNNSIKENPSLCDLIIDYIYTGFGEGIQDHNMDLYLDMVKRCTNY